jgi:hypothetical protein
MKITKKVVRKAVAKGADGDDGVVERKRAVERQLLSFNLTPWLLGKNIPWGSEIRRRIKESAGLAAKHARKLGYLPVVEIVEGPKPDESLYTELASVCGAGRKRIGLAIDDQWGPGTDLLRLEEIARFARLAKFAPVIMKVDFQVVRKMVAPDALTRKFKVEQGWRRGYYPQMVDALVGMSLLAARVRGIHTLVFEGWEGDEFFFKMGASSEGQTGIKQTDEPVRRLHQRELVEALRGAPKRLDGLLNLAAVPAPLSGGSGHGIELMVQGTEGAYIHVCGLPAVAAR